MELGFIRTPYIYREQTRKLFHWTKICHFVLFRFEWRIFFFSLSISCPRRSSTIFLIFFLLLLLTQLVLIVVVPIFVSHSSPFFYYNIVLCIFLCLVPWIFSFCLTPPWTFLLYKYLWMNVNRKKRRHR